MVGYCHHDLNGSRPVVTSCPSCAKDRGALRAGDQRGGERGEAAEGRQVGGAAHVLSGARWARCQDAVGCCGQLAWEILCGKTWESGLIMYIIYYIYWYFMMCTYNIV